MRAYRQSLCVFAAGKAGGANGNKPLAESSLEVVQGADYLAENRMKDQRPEVRALAKEQYEMRFCPKQWEKTEDNFTE